MALKVLRLAITTTATPQSIAPNTHTPVMHVILESETGNADMKVGGSDLSTTAYGFILEAGPTKRQPIGPFGGGSSPFNLNDIWVSGTTTQVVHVTYVTQ